LIVEKMMVFYLLQHEGSDHSVADFSHDQCNGLATVSWAKRDGTLSDDSFAKGWLKSGLHEKWRNPIGEGFSGVAASNGQLFTMDSDGKDEFLVSLNASTGKELWRLKIGQSPNDVYGGLGPRVTPSIDENTIFTVSAQGDLLAIDQSGGRILWRKALAVDPGWRPAAEGTSCSPLVQDGRIYLLIGGANNRTLAAFDQKTGKTIWTSQEDRISYSSAVRWDFSGQPQVLFLAGSNLFSVNATTGSLFWKYSWPTYDYVNVATPIIIPPDRVFISSGYDQGAAMLRVSSDKSGRLQVSEVWRNREMKNHFNNSIHHDGVIYGFDNAILKAVDASSGATLWRKQGLGTGSLVGVGNFLIILSASGDLICAEANRERFNILKRIQALNGKSWTPPSIAANKIFLRNQTEIVCLVVG
jgi:outer membrane protein assembly factor BamB